MVPHTNQPLLHQRNATPVPSGHPDNLIHIRLGATHKLVFLLGIAVGLAAARSGLVGAGIDTIAVASRGYEYDAEEDCVIVRQVMIS